ncbi:MAG: hypothetical protein HC831_31375 [Chloroflexia bacterium]|nr:hypothetical protein [Chloroflexia bacterium]
MDEVIVKSQSSCKDITLGKANHMGLGYVDYYSAKEKYNDKLGREIGAIINLSPKSVYSIKEINVYVTTTQFKKVFFRICFYKVKNDVISEENILNQDIIWEITENNIGWNKLDLTKYNIILHDLNNVAVTLQWINSEPKNEQSKFFSIKGVKSINKNLISREKVEVYGILMLETSAFFYKLNVAINNFVSKTQDFCRTLPFSMLLQFLLELHLLTCSGTIISCIYLALTKSPAYSFYFICFHKHKLIVKGYIY